MLSGQAQMSLSQHPERPALTNKFGPFDGGLRRSSGRCHFTPVGRSLSKAPLGKQKTGHHPEDTLFGSALPPDIPRVLGELEIASKRLIGNGYDAR
jgi:hypothetical protein